MEAAHDAKTAWISEGKVVHFDRACARRYGAAGRTQRTRLTAHEYRHPRSLFRPYTDGAIRDGLPCELCALEAVLSDVLTADRGNQRELFMILSGSPRQNPPGQPRAQADGKDAYGAERATARRERLERVAAIAGLELTGTAAGAVAYGCVPGGAPPTLTSLLWCAWRPVKELPEAAVVATYWALVTAEDPLPDDVDPWEAAEHIHATPAGPRTN